MRKKKNATVSSSSVTDQKSPTVLITDCVGEVKSKLKNSITKSNKNIKNAANSTVKTINNRIQNKKANISKKNTSKNSKISNIPKESLNTLQNINDENKDIKEEKKKNNSRTRKRKVIDDTQKSLKVKSKDSIKVKAKVAKDDKVINKLNDEKKDKVNLYRDEWDEAESEDFETSNFSTVKKKCNKKSLKENSKNVKTKISSNDEKIIPIKNEKIEDESSESEWEEVKEIENYTDMDLDDYKPDIPKEGVEITLNVSDAWKHSKRKKREIDVMDIIRREVNRIRKNVQIDLHKVHLLCLLAHGFYVNKLLLNKTLFALILSHIPIDFNLNKIFNKNDLSKTVKWFKENFDYDFTFEISAENIKISVQKAIEKCKIINHRDFNIIFLLLIRSLGLEARLCLSLYPLPIKSADLLQNKNKISKDKNSDCKETKKENENKQKNCKNRKKGTTENEKAEKNSQSTLKDGVKFKKSMLNDSNSDSDFEASKNMRSNYKLRKKKKLNMKETDSDDEDDDDNDSDDFCIEEEKSQNSSSTKIKKSQNKSSETKKSTSTKLSKTKTPNRKISSESDDDIRIISKSNGIEYWLEIYSESEGRWICVDCVNNVIDKPYKLETGARQPITYVLAFDGENCVKDVTRRYASNWMTNVRKLRVDSGWWEETLSPFISSNSKQLENEDKQLNQIMIDQPLPKTIDKFKNHPLYVLKRHLLKFQAIYPPDSPSLGFIRGEPIYARECVHTLHSRETWLKEARIVRIGEVPYKIVKARPKWNKMKGELEHDLPLEVFGIWQTEKYIPPPAENGKVPRNEYGNVELYQPSMLPAGTVHIKLPGLIRIARKLNIDCAPAMIGFDGNWGHSHPVFDGVVVCEEFRDVLIAAWDEEQEIQQQREKEKREKRIYGNWRRLIKSLLARERIKNKYCLN